MDDDEKEGHDQVEDEPDVDHLDIGRVGQVGVDLATTSSLVQGHRLHLDKESHQHQHRRQVDRDDRLEVGVLGDIKECATGSATL